MSQSNNEDSYSSKSVVEDKPNVVRDAEKLFSLDNYTFKSPGSKVPRGHVRSLCNLYDKELKERETSPTKISLRNVGKLPGFENYPSATNQSWQEENSGNFVNLNRSRSFNCSSSFSTQDSNSPLSISPCQDEAKGNISSPNSTRSHNSTSSESPEMKSTVENEKAKSSTFKGLFRSRSWSLRRRKNKVDIIPNKVSANSQSSSSLTNAKTVTPKRCSPSYSVKSQDSGFSDSGESNHGVSSRLDSNEKCQEENVRRQNQSIAQKKRLEFLTATHEEDEEDPNLTQLPTHVDNPIYSYVSDLKVAKEAKDKVASSVGNIASISEGLRMKRSLMEDNDHALQTGIPRQCVNITDKKITDKNVDKEDLSRNFSNFIRPKSVVVQFRNASPLISPKAYNINNTSHALDNDRVVFSTPLRESFRKRQQRPKTMAVFNLEEAKTPSKRASKNPKLKEMKKISQLRRWSNIEVADMRNEQDNTNREDTRLPKIHSSEEVDVDEHLRECKEDETLRISNLSQIPAGIDPSMIAVWSQLADFEADLPENISTYSYLSNTQKTPRKFDGYNITNKVNTFNNNNNTNGNTSLIKQDLSSTQLSNIDYPSLDASVARDVEDDSNDPNLTPLSRMESCCVDGTSTQLLVESYCNNFKQTRRENSPGYEAETLLDASFSINNSSRSATLLSIPPVTRKTGSNSSIQNGNAQSINQEMEKNTKFLLCPRKTNTGAEPAYNNRSDLNDSVR